VSARPEEELMLALCGTAQRRRQLEASISALAQRVDYGLLGHLMARQRLLPVLGARLLELAPRSVPTGFAEQLRETTARARARGLVLETLDWQIRRDLELAGIAALPLKGATLSRALYGDPGMRSSGDIDILVELEQLDQAAAALAPRGYRRAGGEDEVRRRLHLTLEHPKLPPVELHWRVHWYEEEFSRRMLWRSEAGADGARPRPPDELASLLLFFARDGLTGLRLATDAAAWWDLHAPLGEAAALDRVVAEAPALRNALLAAAITLERLVGIPAAAMLSGPSPPRRARLATRLADWTVSGDLDQVGANITLVDWLLSPPGHGWAFTRRTLLPPSSRINSMYGLGDGAHSRRALWRLAHGPKLLLRYLIALWRIRGGRRWAQIPNPGRSQSRAA
jgi:Uncharacterised nucleotidyltransferase